MTREPALAAAILRAIDDQPNVRVPVQTLLASAAAVDRTAASSVGWRARVLVAINDLSGQGKIRLPKTSWDRSGAPALPMYIDKVVATPGRRPSLARPVWHFEMSWAAQLWDRGELSETDRRYLIAINAWLPRRTGTLAPMRERSLEIFDDEKVLDTLTIGPLFTPKRLTWQLLAAFPCWPPVEQTVLGDGDWLVIENYTTYHSVVHRAAEGDAKFGGRIIWGSGNQVATRLSALADTPNPQRCWYFGDIDAGGFRVARSAAKRAEQLGFPRLTPARGLYHLALEHGKQRADPSSRKPSEASLEWIRTWTGGQLGHGLATTVRLRHRIVQEHIGRIVLATTTADDWFHTM
ncbi:Wadjet anti-phage system protein JetD domain-containing protein [Nocardia nova]|uniref:Wadjet anti-phage system protein JetD domain-containing protein n=1 Tax=Nocardia nova TaxID=37330 RepID=UPI0033DD1732